MKHLKTYKQLNEGRKENIMAGLMATSLASCVKKDAIELTINYGFRKSNINSTQTTDSRKEYVGDKTYWVSKEELGRDREPSPQNIFSELPSPEQMAIWASYRNYESEIRKNTSGDKAFLFDLSKVEIKQGIVTNVEASKITETDIYKKAWEWCQSNSDNFQSDLNNLKDAKTKPIGLLGDLNNFDAREILNNPKNKPIS